MQTWRLKKKASEIAFFPRSETDIGELRTGRPKKIPKGIKDVGIDGNQLAPGLASTLTNMNLYLEQMARRCLKLM